jgi:hypothetical protein
MKKSFIRNFVLISFLSIIISRLLPHPPNFTSTIAVAFYLPTLFGAKFIIVALSAFIISDLILGLHSLVFFTWGSLFLIAYYAKYFKKFYFRIFGVSLSCIIFFLVSNFGVWTSSGLYTKNLEGLVTCYTMAIPFLQSSLIGTIIFSILIELLLCLNNTKSFIKRVNTIN